MDLKEAIASRRSIRRFERRAVPKDIIERVLDAARRAPSTMNKQPWFFTVATGKARDEIMSALGRSVGIIEDIITPFHLEKRAQEEIREEAVSFYSNLGGAPVILVVSIPLEDSSFVRKMYLESAAMAIQNLMLAAHAEGLGTCALVVYSWIEREVKKLIGADDQEIALFLALGYPAQAPKAPPRRADVVQWLE